MKPGSAPTYVLNPEVPQGTQVGLNPHLSRMKPNMIARYRWASPDEARLSTNLRFESGSTARHVGWVESALVADEAQHDCPVSLGFAG
jgi:hypothetical protein